ncbi:hypothetical protein LZ32DRAFT_664251 [Colletotrichum eremochloae]|nr:hypothetical protein LZ32DRAFT_664251 [Colletotrichum eremochloae]
MFPQIRTCRRKGVLSALLIFFLLATLADALDEATANATLQDLSHLYLVPEASCAGHEGQWNCLSDRFQHCVDGLWSDILSCSGAETASAVEADSGSGSGSLCSPLGRTDLVEFEGECSAAWSWGDGSGGWGGGGGVRCNGNRCHYGAGTRLDAGPWVYVSVVAVLLLGLW